MKGVVPVIKSVVLLILILMSNTNLLIEFKHPTIEEVQSVWPLVGNALSFESRKW